MLFLRNGTVTMISFARYDTTAQGLVYIETEAGCDPGGGGHVYVPSDRQSKQTPSASCFFSALHHKPQVNSADDVRKKTIANCICVFPQPSSAPAARARAIPTVLCTLPTLWANSSKTKKKASQKLETILEGSGSTFFFLFLQAA